jgi:hypothetical protein
MLMGVEGFTWDEFVEGFISLEGMKWSTSH